MPQVSVQAVTLTLHIQVSLTLESIVLYLNAKLR